MWSKKNFSSSLAPAFMSHILFVFFSGLIFNRLSLGIYGGIIIAITLGAIYALKNKAFDFKVFINDEWNNGLMIFTFLYIFCFITNQDKKYVSWDEFSH